MKYRPLFDLSLTHTYYADGRCPDFIPEPTPATAKLLRDHRAVLKTKTDGIRILLPVDAGGEPFIPLPAGGVFAFRLVLQNRDFMLFTDLTDSPATAVRCYDNRGLDDPAGGRLALSDSPAQRPSAGFAEVEIYVNASLPAITGGPGHFEIAFSARRFYWEYYLVTNLHDGTAGFRLEYTRAAAGDTPILFTHQPVADRQNKLLSILTAQYPDTQCIHFVSQEAVVCRSAARKNLRLLLNNDPLLDYLPNPALHNFSRHAVTDSAGSKTHDSLFQIVRYITHPFTTSGI